MEDDEDWEWVVLFGNGDLVVFKIIFFVEWKIVDFLEFFKVEKEGN